jgi:hypothetical protein
VNLLRAQAEQRHGAAGKLNDVLTGLATRIAAKIASERTN